MSRWAAKPVMKPVAVVDRERRQAGSRGQEPDGRRGGGEGPLRSAPAGGGHLRDRRIAGRNGGATAPGNKAPEDGSSKPVAPAREKEVRRAVPVAPAETHDAPEIPVKVDPPAPLDFN